MIVHHTSQAPKCLASEAQAAVLAQRVHADIALTDLSRILGTRHRLPYDRIPFADILNVLPRIRQETSSGLSKRIQLRNLWHPA